MTPVIWLAGLASVGLACQPESGFVVGDATRGAEVIRERGCMSCHTLNASGPLTTPALGRRLSRNYSPGTLAGVLWNHAHPSWGKDGKAFLLVGEPAAGEQEVADLYAWFASLRYFERRGDAARGKRIFAQKGCAGCHGTSSSVQAGAPPVTAWTVLRDPVAAALAMWNRPPRMADAFLAAGRECPTLNRQELTDLLIYLENLAPVRSRAPKFLLAPLPEGERAFQEKGCGGCHQGRLSLAARGARLTPVEIAAALWNHDRTNPAAHVRVTYEEMTGILAYVWNLGGQGNPRRGEAVFARRGCSRCHAGGGGAAAELGANCQNGELAPVHIITAIWNHGPAMRSEAAANGVDWPRLRRTDMDDLLAYLQARRHIMTSQDLGTPEPSQVAGRKGGMPRRE